jgi:hypothetical protein
VPPKSPIRGLPEIEGAKEISTLTVYGRTHQAVQVVYHQETPFELRLFKIFMKKIAFLQRNYSRKGPEMPKN